MKFRQDSQSMKHSTNERVEESVSLYAVAYHTLQRSIYHLHPLFFLHARKKPYKSLDVQ